MASNNMYRVGDFVYFESSATAPYQIRRIDELNKTSTGAVEAKVACYYRRRDVSSALINQAEKYYVTGGGCGDSDEEECDSEIASSIQLNENSCPKRSNQTMTDVQRHQLKHRELFLSRQIECLPATHIRGKCSVTLFNEAEPLTNYLNRDEAFYYKLIYDPSLKTLQEDRGSMRIGSDHQSEIQCLLKSKPEDPRMSEVHEELIWKPNSMNDQEVDMFCLLARAVGTFGRAHDTSAVARQPLLLSAAAAASRDITRQYAHNILHQAGYDFNKAIALLVPNGQLTIYRDQLEDWSANEAQLFEEALEKYAKVFQTILTDCLPWKTHKAIVELYYFWKTTDRYIRQRRTKLAAQEHKLKQVYIPNYSKPNPAVLYNGSDKPNRGCEGCGATNSPQWYAWGVPNPATCRLCAGCWSYWKRYGGLKNPESKVERSTSAASASASSRNQQQPANSNESTNETELKSVGGPINITGSINHQFKSHSIGIPSYIGGTNESDETDNNNNNINKQANNTSGTNGLSTKCLCDPLSFFGDFVGTPRGTQCFRTPAIIRLARVLCPQLIRPSHLARRPNRLVLVSGCVAAAAAAAVADDEDDGGDAHHVPSPQQQTTTPKDSFMSLATLNNSDKQILSYNALKIAAEPIIARLQNPADILNRVKKSLSLTNVIQDLVARKGITLQSIDITSSNTKISSSLSLSSSSSLLVNGPTSPVQSRRKRPHSPTTVMSASQIANDNSAVEQQQQPLLKKPNLSDDSTSSSHSNNNKTKPVPCKIMKIEKDINDDDIDQDQDQINGTSPSPSSYYTTRTSSPNVTTDNSNLYLAVNNCLTNGNNNNNKSNKTTMAAAAATTDHSHPILPMVCRNTKLQSKNNGIKTTATTTTTTTTATTTNTTVISASSMDGEDEDDDDDDDTPLSIATTSSSTAVTVDSGGIVSQEMSLSTTANGLLINATRGGGGDDVVVGGGGAAVAADANLSSEACTKNQLKLI